MAVNDVLMKYDDIAAFSKEVADHQKNFETLLSDLDKLAGDLESAWKGYAAIEFEDAFESLRPRLKRFSNLLAAYQTEIDLAIADSSKTQNESAKRIDRILTFR